MTLASSRQAYAVVVLRLDSGERLPTLVDATTWFPARLATRWAVRYRRYRVQVSTLTSDLRVLCKVYTWASVQGIDLDGFLLAGHLLSVRQIESLVLYFRESRCLPTTTFPRLCEEEMPLLSPSSFDHHLSVAQAFFTWAIESGYRPEESSESAFERIAAARAHLASAFLSLRIGARPAHRIEPLSDEEIACIRRAIAPEQAEHGLWCFPPDGFSNVTRLRNWLMFETALGLGLRRGELLKLRMDGLPRGKDNGIRVMRLPDDPRDSRRREPAVKTAERIIPASRELLQALRAYLTLPPPLGRVAGKTPYLFVTAAGSPVAIDTADDIIEAIGRKSGLDLSWHRLRHTWAERTAKICLAQPHGLDLLMYLGGWTNPVSVKHYIQSTIAQQASELLEAYQRSEGDGL